MKVLAINSSARKDGNTAILINRVFEEFEGSGRYSTGFTGLFSQYLCQYAVTFGTGSGGLRYESRPVCP